MRGSARFGALGLGLGLAWAALGFSQSPRDWLRLSRKTQVPLVELRRLKRERNLDFATLETLDGRRLAKARGKLQKPKASNPSEAYDYLELRRDGGYHAASVQARAQGFTAFAALPKLSPPASLQAKPWDWLGPGNIGGRTRSLLVHPKEPNLVYAGSTGGGVFLSEDGAKTWRPLADDLPSTTVACMALHPKDPETLLVGTGEGFFRGRGVPGFGVFRTKDRGKSFESLAGTQSEDFLVVNRLAFSANGESLLVATHRGIFLSGDQGETFRRVHDQETLDLDCPSDPNPPCLASGSQGEILVADSSLTHWKPARGLPSISPGSYVRIELGRAKADPKLVYASVDVEGGQVFRSLDGGESFEPRRTVDRDPENPERIHYLGVQGWYDNTIWAGSPFDPDLVVVGGLNLWRSQDGGETFERISRWEYSPQSAHADHHVITATGSFDDRENFQVFFGNDGGVYEANVREVEGLFGWEARNQNYGVTQFYHAVFDPVRGTVVGGTQDNGTLLTDPTQGTHGWHEIFGGDGGFNAWDPAYPDTFYGEYVFANLFRTLDRGRTAEFISGLTWDGREIGWKKPPYLIEDVPRNHALFIAPFHFQRLPSTPEGRLWVGAHSLWLSEDPRAKTSFSSGPKWRAVLPGRGDPRQRNFISAIASNPKDPEELWVGYVRGELSRGRSPASEGATFEDLRLGKDHPRRTLNRIAFSAAESDTVFLAFSGFTPGNLWRSPDRGKSFQDVSEALPPVPILDLVVHPQRPSEWMVATPFGPLVSFDAGGHWHRIPGGPGSAPVEQLVWLPAQARIQWGASAKSPGVVASVTYGRGIYLLHWPEASSLSKARDP